MKRLISPVKITIFLIGISTFILLMGFQFSNTHFTNYEPILMDRSDMEESVMLRDARAIESPGKIWIYNDIILLVEQYKGIHVIDNSNPETSKTIAFIQIDGCTEITMRGDVLYANNAVDMIGIKTNSNFSELTIVARSKNILPQISSPEPWNDWYYHQILPPNTVIVRWGPYQK